MAEKHRIVVAKASACKYFNLQGRLILPLEMDKGYLQGYVFRFHDENNYGMLVLERSEFSIVGHGTRKTGKLGVYKVIGGVRTLLQRVENPEWVEGLVMEVSVDESGHGIFSANGEPQGTFSDTVFATGTLKEGKCGVYDGYAEAPVIAAKRKYQEPLVTSVASQYEEIPNAVCYAGRQMEIRWDGVYRQHITDDVWARLTPEGFLPYSPPSGLEERPARTLLLPSIGNFEVKPDSEKVKASAQIFYFPGYHFISEAE